MTTVKSDLDAGRVDLLLLCRVVVSVVERERLLQGGQVDLLPPGHDLQSNQI